MPLAIELAAARVRALSPHEIAQRVGQQLRLLTSSQRADVPHHQTLQATIAWSYELLTEAERIVFNRLSVFRGGCTLEAAERVCAGDGIEPNDVLDLLTSLVDKSMLVADISAEDKTRYHLLETLRQFGHERLIESGQENEICQRHAEYFTELGEQLDTWVWGSHDELAHEQWLAEEDNIFAAMHWSANYSDGVLAVRLGGTVVDCNDNWSHYRWAEFADSLIRAYERGGPISAAAKVKAQIAIAGCYELLRDPESTLRYSEEALALARQFGDQSLIGRALLTLALEEGTFQLPDRLRVHAAECVDIGRETNDVHLLSALYLLGYFEPPDRRLALLEEFLAAALRGGSAGFLLYARHSLAYFALEGGELQRSKQLLEECYRQCEIANKGWLARISSDLGQIALRLGEYAHAISLFENSRNKWRALGWERLFAFPTRWLGKVAWYQGDDETALRHYQECYDILQRFSDRDEMAVTQIHQAMLLRDQGEYQRAKQLCDEGLEVIRQVNWKGEIGWALAMQASIVQCLGEPERAVEVYRESLPYFNESSDRILKVEVIEGLGVALASAKDYARGAHLLAFAEAQRNQMGIILPPPEQPYHDEAIRILREALDEATLTQAWEAGQAMTLEEAVAEALEPKECHPERSEGSLAIK
jgi:tetratricopeptide (TPR) repeat protein